MQLTKEKKGMQTFILMSVISLISILLGIFLIITPNHNIKAHKLADTGTIYLIEANRSKKNKNLLQQAYTAHLQAICLSPYDADLWMRFIYSANANKKYEKAKQALNIAQTLSPPTNNTAYKQQLNKTQIPYE